MRYTIQLLPHRFTPRDLLGESAYFLFEEHHNKLFWSAESEKLLAEMKKKKNNNEMTQMHEMAVKALAEANSSYAQYSQCPSGICISDHEGNLYSGGLVESAAYNPTVSPLHAALVNGLTNGLKGWKEVSYAKKSHPPRNSILPSFSLSLSLSLSLFSFVLMKDQALTSQICFELLAHLFPFFFFSFRSIKSCLWSPPRPQ